jgi:haloacetate dehalogenase
MMFEGFERLRVKTEEAEIEAVKKGGGPPLLLVHGYPQTKAMWHKIAPGLAERFTVVATDSRGYGASSRPPSDQNHAAYSKRRMAADLVKVMASLGFERFFVAGHDRGGRVAYRMALDHPARVTRLAVLDIVPTYEQFATVDRQAALGSFHWYFLAQPPPFPERLIGADPEYFIRHMLGTWAGTKGCFSDEALAEYIRCFKDPEVIRASCEDYRAGTYVDCQMDEEDLKAGRKITCPVLAIWGGRGRSHQRRPVLETWRRWAADVQGEGLPCGHFLAEEAPEATRAALEKFFAS